MYGELYFRARRRELEKLLQETYALKQRYLIAEVMKEPRRADDKVFYGVNKEELLEEGFAKNELAQMVEWDENLSNPIKDGYIIAGNIITSVSYNFIKWALAFGKMVGLHIPPKTFGM